MKKSILLCLMFFAAFNAFAQLSEKVGIGVRLQIDSSRGYKLTKIIALVPNGAAQAAGLQQEELVLKVDGQPTRNVLLEDVVAMIVGNEGTPVKLEIERSGITRNYTITRGKYKYANTFYQPVVKDDAFCNALAALMNDAAYDFEHTMDTLHYKDEGKSFSRRYYECKVKVPGAKRVAIISSFGTTGFIDFGNFNTTDEVNKAGQALIEQIKECFPDYYYNPTVEKDGTVSVQIGKKYDDGFESAILNLTYYTEEGTTGYKMALYVNGGTSTRFYSIDVEVVDNAFSKSLRTIFNDIPNKYRNVKGTKHESKSTGFFSSTTYWYDIVPLPDGAHDCTLSEGGLGLGNGCRCRFYQGESREDAVAAYKTLFTAMRKAFGSEFVYTMEKSDLDMTIPKDAEGVVTFGIKKKRSYESAPLVSLVLIKSTEGKYAVNMLFHEFGF